MMYIIAWYWYGGSETHSTEMWTKYRPILKGTGPPKCRWFLPVSWIVDHDTAPARCIRIPTLSGHSLHSHYSHPPSQLSTQPGAHLLLRNSRSRLLGLAESVSSSSIESSLPDRAPFTSLTNSFSLAAAITDTIVEGGGDTVSMNDSKIEKKKRKV